MAAQPKKDQPIASHVIAQRRGIPERFLLKVLKPLVSAQVLFSVKGPNGGYRLARAAGDISILDVLEAVDGPIRGHAPAGLESDHGPLQRKLDQICAQSADLVRKQLAKIKVSELASRE
jgi:Rrf2 family protein